MTYERQQRKSNSTTRRHKLLVTRLERVNEGGFSKVARIEICEVWATLDPISERQRHEYQSISTEVTHVVRTSAKADILEKDELHWQGRVFEILTSINIQEIENERLITAKEIRPKGVV